MKIKANDKLKVIRASAVSDMLPLGAIVYAIYGGSDYDTIQVSEKPDGVGQLKGSWDVDRFELVTDSVDFDKPVQTRNGQAVTIITTAGRDKQYPVMAYVGDNDGATMFTAEGFYYADREVSKLDLVNVPVEIVMYMNVYPTNSVYKTRAEADAGAAEGRIGCNRIVLTPTFDA